MKQVSFEELVASVDELGDYCVIYAKEGEWERSPLDAKLFLANDDEVDELEGLDNLDEEGLQRRGLSYVIMADLFEDVVYVERRYRPNATLADIVDAVNHYLEYDDFRD